jgi:hypothetical protein
MTVKELKEELEKFDENLDVMIEAVDVHYIDHIFDIGLHVFDIGIYNKTVVSLIS